MPDSASSRTSDEGSAAVSGSSWRKASASVNHGQCVEVADTAGAMLVRDSTLGDCSPILSVSPDAWKRFLADVKNCA